jgi:hypothetical protein
MLKFDCPATFAVKPIVGIWPFPLRHIFKNKGYRDWPNKKAEHQNEGK